MKKNLEPRLERFLAILPWDELACQLNLETGMPETDIRSTLTTYANEAHVTLNMVGDSLSPGQRILEIGAGLCLFSLFLKSEGFEITALEPSRGGYGFFEQSRQAIAKQFPSLELPVLTCPAEALTPEKQGSFDIIFSNNVIEHIPDWEAALAAMSAILAIDGRMIHACPNYFVPYEPHYGIPVFRYWPSISKKLFLPADADPEIWDSLNFISYRQVRNFAGRRSLYLRFRQGLLYNVLMRMNTDPLFRERHKGPVAVIVSMLNATGAMRLLKHLPAAVSTPMIFELSSIPLQEQP